jgi:transcriptional regulator with XRE-family HTH domain
MQRADRKGKRLLEGFITAEQCRAARGAIGWSQVDLAEAARLSRPTIQEFERGARATHENNLVALRAALESKGVRFWELEDGRLGIDFPLDRPSPTDKED